MTFQYMDSLDNLRETMQSKEPGGLGSKRIHVFIEDLVARQA